MKIVYCNGVLTPHYDGAVDMLRSKGHEVIHFDLSADEDEKNRWLIRHFQIYENILNLAEDADLLYFSCPIGCPEVLLSELRVRPNFKAKIVSIMNFRGLDRSPARALVVKDLINHPSFFLMGFGTMIVDGFRFPSTMEGVDKDKIMLLNEPFNESRSIFASITKREAREKFGLLQDAFYVLQSGGWSKIKGADLFVKATKYLRDDVKILFHKSSAPDAPAMKQDPTMGLELWNDFKQNSNATIIERWIPEGQMAYLYKASDLVVCAHRRYYTYSSSGVPNMAASAGIPIVAPNFYYFDEIVNRYKVGVLYEPENVEDMAAKILYAKDNYAQIMKEAQFEKSLENYHETLDIPSKVFKRLNLI
jgi:glycosyltransferase involved in cell wall biosynthesis